MTFVAFSSARAVISENGRICLENRNARSWMDFVRHPLCRLRHPLCRFCFFPVLLSFAFAFFFLFFCRASCHVCGACCEAASKWATQHHAGVPVGVYPAGVNCVMACTVSRSVRSVAAKGGQKNRRGTCYVRGTKVVTTQSLKPSLSLRI